MYRDGLKILERKFGQPQNVVTAHLDSFSNYPPKKMHNSDTIINFATTVSSLVGVFSSLAHDSVLHSLSVLSEAGQKLPPKLKESWSSHTVKKEWFRSTMLVFNNWLKEEAEAHERRKTISLKSRTEDNCCISATETKGSSKVFAGNANAKQQISSKTSQNAKNNQLACVLCKCQHPIGEKILFIHSIFKGEEPLRSVLN